MFLFKKIVAEFFGPLTVCCGLLGVGTVLLFLMKTKRAKQCIFFGLVLLVMVSYSRPLSLLMVSPLEDQYACFNIADFSAKQKEDIKWVVILGAGHCSDPTRSLSGQIGKTALNRLVEGISIFRKLPAAKIIVSGGVIYDPVSHAEIMRDMALELGVPADKIVLNLASKDTKDEALHIARLLKANKCVLVTSAIHMPRAMALFHKAGVFPIAAPTDYCVKRVQGSLEPSMFFPRARNISGLESAIHEYLGLIWGKLRGQL